MNFIKHKKMKPEINNQPPRPQINCA